ncbi:helix-turn-helix transcriptional regulator [Enterococcus timonensis]|uniref:helix-turn-helix transcriptional regulator n=1 Tax=Enterococcus timonensis TaxID=1852364 RepID=UPI0008D98F2D|nr:helix-turn-helix transcriptional regulator [Enterococcus timonensis]
MKERIWLRKKREKAGLTILEASRLTELSKQGYWFIESGRRDPSVHTAMRIAKAFSFEWTIFFDKNINKC